jgi:hypothetical protein
MRIATCFATRAERARRLPGDEIVPAPFFSATHAITIEAPPDKVWPWLAQMGAGRAGWYSWDAIDNGGQRSAAHVVADLQAIAPGDVMPGAPGADDAFVVEVADPGRDLILTAPDGVGGHAVSWEPLRDERAGHGRSWAHGVARSSTCTAASHAG